MPAPVFPSEIEGALILLLSAGRVRCGVLKAVLGLWFCLGWVKHTWKRWPGFDAVIAEWLNGLLF